MANPRRVPKRLNHEPEAVRWARERSLLSQTELAELSGIGRTLIVEYEAGTRSATPENLIKMARAMNCPVVALERKRAYESEATSPSAYRVRQLQDQERADTADVPELRGSALTDGAA